MIGILKDIEIEDMLKSNSVGRLGFNNGNKTYVIPVNYAYDGRFVIAHSVEGMKVAVMRQHPYVCFEVDEINSSTRWKSVIVWGEYQELKESRDRSYAIKLFSERFIHLKTNGPTHQSFETSSLVFNPVIYRIVIVEKSGRFEND